MSFEEYLESKKIDSGLFQIDDIEKWNELKKYFSGSGPEQFTNSKKFLINPIRRLYHLKEKKTELTPVTVTTPLNTGTGTPVRKKPMFKK